MKSNSFLVCFALCCLIAMATSMTPDPSLDNSDFVKITDVIPDAILEVRYFSTYNFVGDRIDGYNAPVSYLTKEAAAALKKASDVFVKDGYRIRVYDAYRPQMAVDHFKAWAKDVE
ncbi:MAG: hypothetical protein J6P50_07745, partial [Bacteroidales bacterium]|nr:hypothetical protein [Bacteroidales bacterium]